MGVATGEGGGVRPPGPKYWGTSLRKFRDFLSTPFLHFYKIIFGQFCKIR